MFISVRGGFYIHDIPICVCVYICTLGPRGPFLQSGVEVVSQLAQRRARSGSPPPPFPPPRSGAFVAEAEGGACLLVWRMSQQKLEIDDRRPWPPPRALLPVSSTSSLSRVEGVPSERVQSTEGEDEAYEE